MANASSRNMDRVAVGLILYLLIISLFFVIVKPTLLFILCYVFAVAGGIEFAVSLMILAGKDSKLPQDIVFPIIAKSYMVVNLLISVVFLLLEQTFMMKIAIIYPLLIHIIFITIFTFRVLALHAGKEHMEAVNEKATKSVNFQRSKSATLSTILAKVNVLKISAAEKSAACKQIRKVMEAVRYSDPMTPEELEDMDDDISERISELTSVILAGEISEIDGICNDLLVMIQNRNEQIRALKRSQR